MRSTDEQLQEIMRRAEIVKEKRNIRNHIYASLAASCVCVALLVVAGFCIPRLEPLAQQNEMQQYGSLLLAAPYTGYVVISLIAFALGVCVTLLCVHWKKLRQKEQGHK